MPRMQKTFFSGINYPQAFDGFEYARDLVKKKGLNRGLFLLRINGSFLEGNSQIPDHSNERQD